MANNMFMGLVMAFVGVIIGVALLSTSADTVSTVTDTYNSVVSKAFTAGTPLELMSTTSYDVNSVTSLTKGAVVCNETTDWEFDSTANTVNLTGTAACGTATYNVSYNYQTSSYVSDGASRSVINLIIIFFALAVVMSVLMFVDFRQFGLK